MVKGAQKVVLLGDSGVGKSALVRRFLHNEFTGRESKTAPIPEASGSLAAEKKVRIDDDSVTLSIWDTAGEERFRALQPIYYANARGAVLVYDLTDPEDTFQKVKQWVKQLRQQDQDIHIAIAANKLDLAFSKGNEVDTSEMEAFAKLHNATHHLTSAKQGTGVTPLFVALASKILKGSPSVLGDGRPKQLNHTSNRRTGRGRGMLHIDEDETTRLTHSRDAQPPPAEGTKCCCAIS